ncbi:MAG: hypothetical protein ACI978_002495 [Oleispira sp.]|jgi:hypothetical protein
MRNQDEKKSVFCGYLDEEMDQDVPLTPTLAEAISFFRNFIWENEKSESSMKILSFTILDEAYLQISTLTENLWCVTASVSTRRRFLGPFFKRESFRIFLDINASETENIIRLLYQDNLNELNELLKIRDY